MKILEIRPKHRATDGKLYYRVRLDGTPYPLILWETPPFSEGQDVPRDSLVLNEDVWLLKAESADKDASIREQTAIKIVADLFIADKLDELANSEEYLVKCLGQWIDRALIQGPLMQKTLEAQQ